MGVDNEQEGEEKDLQCGFHLLCGVHVTNHLENLAKSEDLEQFADFEEKTCHVVDVSPSDNIDTELFKRNRW